MQNYLDPLKADMQLIGEKAKANLVQDEIFACVSIDPFHKMENNDGQSRYSP